MSVIRVTRRDVFWSYANLVASNIVNLLLLPLALWALTPAELGLWFVFSGLGTIALVLDLGLAVTFARSASLAWSGAERLERHGFETVRGVDRAPNLPLLRGLLLAQRRMYLGIGLVALAFVAPFGTWQIMSALERTDISQETWIAWCVYLIAVVLNVVFSYWTGLLKGVGEVAASQQALVAGKLAQLALTGILLVAGFGLLGLCIGYLVSSVIARGMSVRAFRAKLAGVVRETSSGLEPKARDILSTLWPNSWRQGVVSISQYAYVTAPVLLASALLSLEMAAAVGLTFQVLGLVKVFGNGLYNAYVPLFTGRRVTGDHSDLRRRLALALGVSGAVVLVGGAIALLLLPVLLDVLGSGVVVLPLGVCAVLLLSEWLVNQSSLCSGFIATGNRVPMAFAYAITVGAAIVLNVIAVRFLGWGVWGLVLPGALVWLAYNDWAWFRKCAEDLGLTARGLVRIAVQESCAFALRAARRVGIA
jgi:O-antigen/teichoic acid export membrane protein